TGDVYGFMRQRRHGFCSCDVDRPRPLVRDQVEFAAHVRGKVDLPRPAQHVSVNSLRLWPHTSQIKQPLPIVRVPTERRGGGPPMECPNNGRGATSVSRIGSAEGTRASEGRKRGYGRARR